MITLSEAVRLFECIGAISLLIQTIEFLNLSAQTGREGVWTWSVQRKDLAHANPVTQKIFDVLFEDGVLRAHLWLRLLLISSLFLGSSSGTSVLIFTSTVILLVRWRGAFNGGSDFMTLVFLTSLMIGNLAAPFLGTETAWTVALWYVCVQSLTSYLLSGASKLLAGRWRDGQALTYFLDGGIHGPLRAGSIYRNPRVAIGCSWAFMVWECTAPLVLISQQLASIWCAIAVAFHLLVFRFFGLNRFFWAWVTTLPAIVYCAGGPMPM